MLTVLIEESADGTRKNFPAQMLTAEPNTEPFTWQQATVSDGRQSEYNQIAREDASFKSPNNEKK